MTTWAPSRAKRRASSAPIPRAPPLMMATLFCSLMVKPPCQALSRTWACARYYRLNFRARGMAAVLGQEMPGEPSRRPAFAA